MIGLGPRPPVPCCRVVVTGIGLVTPLGVGTAQTWGQLLSGASATRPLIDVPYYLPSFIAADKSITADEKRRRLEAIVRSSPCQVAAPVMARSSEEDDVRCGIDVFSRAKTRNPIVFDPSSHEPRAFRFSQKAAEEALLDAGFLQRGDLIKPVFPCLTSRVGVNVGMGIPSLADVADVSVHLFGDADNVHYSRVNPFFVPKILGNMAAGALSIGYGLHGPIGSGVAACATGAYCIAEAVETVRRGKADIMICGATESCITPVAVAGFARMRALCTRYNAAPEKAARPFDEERGGFVIGEGAGILVVESLDSAKTRGARIYGEVRGFGVSSDAHHVAAPHPQGRGARQCVRAALEDGGVPASMVRYVNAHATGTMGDQIELRAIEEELCVADDCRERGAPLFVSSTKGALGHLLGAAGSVEAAIAVLSLKHRTAPPNVNLDKPISAHPAVRLLQKCDSNTSEPMEQGTSAPWSAVLSTSFGFGGISTALLFTSL